MPDTVVVGTAAQTRTRIARRPAYLALNQQDTTASSRSEQGEVCFILMRILEDISETSLTATNPKRECKRKRCRTEEGKHAIYVVYQPPHQGVSAQHFRARCQNVKRRRTISGATLSSPLR